MAPVRAPKAKPALGRGVAPEGRSPLFTPNAWACNQGDARGRKQKGMGRQGGAAVGRERRRKAGQAACWGGGALFYGRDSGSGLGEARLAVAFQWLVGPTT